MNYRKLTINQLDKQLAEWQAVSSKCGRPKGGWIKTLREALSMSAEQLANRLGLSRGRIVQLENAEIHDAVTLRTLRETASAIGCELVYAIVPKNHSSLEKIINAHAEQIAKERISRLLHTMSLEAQSVDKDLLNTQRDELVKSLVEHLNKKFWADKPPIDDLAKAIMQSLANHPLANKKIKNNKFDLLREKLIQESKNKK